MHLESLSAEKYTLLEYFKLEWYVIAFELFINLLKKVSRTPGLSFKK